MNVRGEVASILDVPLTLHIHMTMKGGGSTVKEGGGAESIAGIRDLKHFNSAVDSAQSKVLQLTQPWHIEQLTVLTVFMRSMMWVMVTVRVIITE